MNASIQAIIDHMFRDTAVTAETRALHEELLNNCLEHYDDLIGRGMSETEAIDAVVDSLKGMKEVIDEYPKKPGTETKENEKKEDNAADPGIPAPEAEKTAEETPEQKKPEEYVFSSADVRKLRTDLKNCDLKIGSSRDGKIHVRCEDMDQLICTLDGDVLSVRITDRTKQSIDEAAKQFNLNSNEFSVKGLLNFIGKTIGNVASSITVSWNVYIDLPSESLQEMDLNSKSGDIDVKAQLPAKLTMRTMSGDIKAEAEGDAKAGVVSASAMSGEIEFSGCADQISCSSMSGDVKVRGAFLSAVLKSTSGDVEMEGAAAEVQLNSVSGDTKAEMKNRDVRSLSLHSTSGDVDVILAPGTESVHARTSTVSGSVRCSVPDAGSGAALNIDAASVSGDVTIR